jgi:hypothetical protein
VSFHRFLYTFSLKSTCFAKMPCHLSSRSKRLKKETLSIVFGQTCNYYVITLRCPKTIDSFCLNFVAGQNNHFHAERFSPLWAPPIRDSQLASDNRRFCQSHHLTYRIETFCDFLPSKPRYISILDHFLRVMYALSHLHQ